eukprot:COSAG01_NODE_491_length_16354_cov_26.550784_17_plen_91_part_00
MTGWKRPGQTVDQGIALRELQAQISVGDVAACARSLSPPLNRHGGSHTQLTNKHAPRDHFAQEVVVRAAAVTCRRCCERCGASDRCGAAA